MLDFCICASQDIKSHYATVPSRQIKTLLLGDSDLVRCIDMPKALFRTASRCWCAVSGWDDTRKQLWHTLKRAGSKALVSQSGWPRPHRRGRKAEGNWQVNWEAVLYSVVGFLIVQETKWRCKLRSGGRNEEEPHEFCYAGFRGFDGCSNENQASLVSRAFFFSVIR